MVFVFLAIYVFFVSGSHAQLGRCCWGPSDQPYCSMSDEEYCMSRPAFQSWDADLNCTDNPCPILNLDTTWIEMAYESPIWNFVSDTTFEVEVRVKTNISLSGSTVAFKTNRNIATIDSVIWGDSLQQAIMEDGTLGIMKIGNDSLFPSGIMTYFMLGFVPFYEPYIPAITPTEDPILFATAYLSIKPDSIPAILLEDSILFYLDSSYIPPAQIFIFTNHYGFSVHPLFANDSIWIKSSEYLCGDANGDETVAIDDAVWIINYIFVAGDPPEPLEAGDCNCDSICNVSDAVWIINYIFVGGNDPCDTDGDGIPDC
jgi:hypothetical protein